MDPWKGSRILQNGSLEPIDMKSRELQVYNFERLKLKLESPNRGATCGFIAVIACRLAAVQLLCSASANVNPQGRVDLAKI